MEQVGKIIGVVLLGMIVGFAVYGMGCAFTDMRNFKDIAKECEERGYIQDATDRFACVKEKR
jgi:hypothetical protein